MTRTAIESTALSTSLLAFFLHHRKEFCAKLLDLSSCVAKKAYAWRRVGGAATNRIMIKVVRGFNRQEDVKSDNGTRYYEEMGDEDCPSNGALRISS